MAGTIRDRFKQMQASRLARQKGIPLDEAWRLLFESNAAPEAKKGPTNTDVIRTLTQAIDRMSRAAPQQVVVVPQTPGTVPPQPQEEPRVSFDDIGGIIDGLSKGDL